MSTDNNTAIIAVTAIGKALAASIRRHSRPIAMCPRSCNPKGLLPFNRISRRGCAAFSSSMMR